MTSKAKSKPGSVIFVTGGAGFIGSNYLNKYVPVRTDTHFVCVDSLTYAGNLKNLEIQKSRNFSFERSDIRDKAALLKLFKKHKPNGVIHFAAESHVDMSISNPGIFIETNVAGTGNLLSIARETGVSRFLHVSTDEVYGSLQEGEKSFTEESILAPNNPYSASKAGAELLARSYFKTFGLDVVITRSSNNYGPRQDTTKLIPLFMTRLLKGEKVPVYGKGNNVRDWIYVEDNIDAIDTVWQRGKSGEVYNIGGSNEISNIDLTKKLIALTDRDEGAIEYVTDRPGHDFRYSLDSSKIKRELGWSPKISFESGLKKTLAFYKSTSSVDNSVQRIRTMQKSS